MSSIEIPSNYNPCKTHEDKLVMLLEREEYEPLSRAAYYHSPRKDQEKNRNPLFSPTLSEGEGVKTGLKHNNIEKYKTLSES